MRVYEQHGSGLMVCEAAADEESVRRELERLRPSLLLVRRADLKHGCWVYEVWNQPTGEINTCWFVWRDEQGVPLPLSHAILERAKQLLQEDAETVGDRIVRANERRAERLDRDASDWHEWAAVDVARSMDETRSAVLHRGQSLRMARDRMRAKGRKR